jgi:uncharacterized protein (DUF2141 family)
MKSIKQLTLVTVLVLTSMYTHAQQSTISIEITNIQSDEGVLIVGLFDSEKNFLGKKFKGEKMKAVKGKMMVSFDEVPAGTYSISVVHDENENGNLDTNFIGIPKEPYGISIEGKNMYGPPSYDKAKFEVTNKNIDLTISL